MCSASMGAAGLTDHRTGLLSHRGRRSGQPRRGSSHQEQAAARPEHSHLPVVGGGRHACAMPLLRPSGCIGRGRPTHPRHRGAPGPPVHLQLCVHPRGRQRHRRARMVRADGVDLDARRQKGGKSNAKTTCSSFSIEQFRLAAPGGEVRMCATPPERVLNNFVRSFHHSTWRIAASHARFEVCLYDWPQVRRWRHVWRCIQAYCFR